VCDNTDIAQLFYQKISGEETIEVAENGGSAGRKKAKTEVTYGKGRLFPEYFSNRASFRPTLRIDSKLIAEAESDDPKATRAKPRKRCGRLSIPWESQESQAKKFAVSFQCRCSRRAGTRIT
jgi:hypothetical protein